MKSPLLRKRFIAVLALLSLVACLGFLIMGILGCRYYSSAGLDRDTEDGAGRVWHSYYRVQWPGDGTVRFGGSAYCAPRDPSRPLEPFDLGGAFWEPPRLRPPGSGSFYREYFQGRDNWSTFIGMPWWLPSLLLVLPPFAWLNRKTRRIRTV